MLLCASLVLDVRLIIDLTTFKFKQERKLLTVWHAFSIQKKKTETEISEVMIDFSESNVNISLCSCFLIAYHPY